MSMSATLSHSDKSRELVTMQVAGQPFGIPVEFVRDVLGNQGISRIPLAPGAIAGSLNLRGRIVTVIDLQVALGRGRTLEPEKAMNVVIDYNGELYSLLVDQVGDVLSVPRAAVEPLPNTIGAVWRTISEGVVKLEQDLVLVLVPAALLSAAVVANGVGLTQ
jgi:purine-binding chemotaxis protein CheW